MVQLSPRKSPPWPGCEVRCQSVPNRPASSLRPCFVEASPTVKSCIVLKSGSSSLANFVLQAKNAVNKPATDGCVRNFDAGCRGA